ncbi:DUF6349 family protein [Streptacidiphilus cavernicola]|uniref:DUF6349 family protein n=1 Tax=Streptacidiphilus cavernicola TaxID=3342716 RepID=A0ABV6VY18_9ACTN
MDNSQPHSARWHAHAYPRIPPNQRFGCAEWAWHVGTTHPHPNFGPPTGSCRPTVICRGLGTTLRFRGACLNCDHLGPERLSWIAGVHQDAENHAVEDAHDHAFGPSWRSIPAVAAMTYEEGSDPKRRTVRHRMLEHVYGRDWLRRGGPIRTWRNGGGTRHVPNARDRQPWGGYDLSAGTDPALAPAARASVQVTAQDALW